MAQVDVTISGVLYDKYSRVGRPVTLVGQGTIIPSQAGGGPPDKPPGGEPPGIWPGPGDPDFPGGGKPPFLPGYRPEHPIVIPPDRPPDTPPPSGTWEWGWNPQTGWLPVYTTGDKPKPVPPPQK